MLELLQNESVLAEIAMEPSKAVKEYITDVDDYIEFYNHRRLHQTLDYKKTMDVYQKSIKLNQNKKRAS